MRKWMYVAAMMVLGGVVYAAGDGLLATDGPDLTTCEQALALLSKGDRAGFDLLFEQWPDQSQTGKTSADEFADSQAPMLRKMVNASGALCGTELVHSDQVGSFLRRYTYVCKYERARISFTFTFYKPADTWRFDGYHFNSEDNALFSACGHCASLPERSKFSIAAKPKSTTAH